MVDVDGWMDYANTMEPTYSGPRIPEDLQQTFCGSALSETY